jgi:hypothetical protein
MKVIGNRISKQVSTYVGSGATAGVLKSSGAVRVPWKQERGPEVPAIWPRDLIRGRISAYLT